MESAIYKGRRIRNTKGGYVVDGELFATLAAATDYIDLS